MLELQDLDLARRYLWQGFCRQSVLPPSAETLHAVLEWALEIVAGGDPLPPIGFLADVGHLVFATTLARPPHEPPPVPGWPHSLTRTYEDYVLGKLYVDSAFDRGSAALCRYQGRDRAKGLAFLMNAFRQRAGFDGALLTPAAIKAALQRPDEFLPQAWDSLATDGLMPLLPQLTEKLSQAVRETGAVLANEDIFELEHRTALMPFGERLALRQVLHAAEKLQALLPARPRRKSSREQPVATHILDEDTYPVGGFSSISTRGSIESLLHSQLAYMDPQDRPDLFDIKFLRDELLYYSRDENQFFRRRRRFVFALHPDLQKSRVKDAGLPWQRIILVQALIVAAIRRLTEWLGDDALEFHAVFLQDGASRPLAPERQLIELVFREQIANGTVYVSELPMADLPAYCQKQTRAALCRVLMLSSADRPLTDDGFQSFGLRVHSHPGCVSAEGGLSPDPADSPLEAWQRTTAALIEHWI